MHDRLISIIYMIDMIYMIFMISRIYIIYNTYIQSARVGFTNVQRSSAMVPLLQRPWRPLHSAGGAAGPGLRVLSFNVLAESGGASGWGGAVVGIGTL